jgi:hypothetical protein
VTPDPSTRSQVCRHCGHTRDAGAFCPGCGRPVDDPTAENKRWLPYLLVVGGAVVAAAMVVLAVVLTSGGQAATKTVTEQATVTPPPARPPAHHRRRQHHRPPPVAPAPVAPTLVPYSATYYSLDRPAAWTTEHDDEEQSGGFLRSQWRDPADSNTSVLIDAQPEDLSASEKADEVRAGVSQTAGFRDLGRTNTTMNGLPAVRWEFEVSGDRRIDYFVHDDTCGVGAAVLGSTSPGQWSARSETFSQIADSISLDCSEVDAQADDPSDECDPNYEGACLDPTSSDYDCEDGSGDGPDYTGEVSVVGDDHFDLDRDGDGTACDTY